jgi:putative MATE family efflux protein
LAFTVGLVIAVGGQFVAGPLARALAGDEPAVVSGAAHWLRVAAIGAPGLLLATAGNGWLRGVQDTRRPMFYVLGANALSAVLCPVLVYGAGLGLIGSAIANASAQTLSGLLFVFALIRERVSLRPHPNVLGRQLVLGRDLLVRGAAFQASFVSAAAVAARFGSAALAAHQIALQLWFFCALALDAVAIAAQALVGAALGAGDAAEAKALARRITLIGAVSGVAFAIVIGAASSVIPKLFTADREVHAQAAIAWPWFVGLQPIAGVVFALDGVLLGAGDVRYLRNATILSALGGFLPMVWLALAFDLGLGGVWAGLAAFMVIRLVTLLLRLRSGRWAVVGATR